MVPIPGPEEAVSRLIAGSILEQGRTGQPGQFECIRTLGDKGMLGGDGGSCSAGQLAGGWEEGIMLP